MKIHIRLSHSLSRSIHVPFEINVKRQSYVQCVWRVLRCFIRKFCNVFLRFAMYVQYLVMFMHTLSYQISFHQYIHLFQVDKIFKQFE